MDEAELLQCVSIELRKAGQAWQAAAELIERSRTLKHHAATYREHARRIGAERDYIDDLIRSMVRGEEPSFA